MWKPYARWTINILALATILYLLLAHSKDVWLLTWKPYLVFALSNWLFADLLFRYIPQRSVLKNKKLPAHLFADLFIAILLVYVVYSFSSRYLFDDAGFVLRYVANFKEGYFYHFNKTDSPVFGLSGFIYGCVCFAISIFGFSPPTCLKIANGLGSVAYLFILLQLCRHLVNDKRLVWLVFITLALGLETIVLMFASGLELPVHIAIVLATLLFYLKQNHRLFLLFVALSIISKLDAVPVMAVMMILYTWEHIILPKSYKNLKAIFIYSGIPLLIWVITAFVLFGSPLPQSAFAKYYFHPNPDKHDFPFLYYFFKHPVRKIAVIAFEMLAILHLVAMIYTRKLIHVKYFLFGWMFFAIMLMYYYYNPNERMMWYYSLPEFLLYAQVIFSFVHWSSVAPLNKIPILSALPLLAFILPVMKNMNGALEYHNFYTARVERERIQIGNYMYDISTPNDTLMSSHGLVSWKFKGYVMDLSGLNSKLVTNYKRNPDSLLQKFRPHYIINHAWTEDLNIYGKHGYEMDTIFADVTLVDYPYWAIMKRAPSKKRGYAKIPLDICNNKYDVLDQAQVVRFYSDSLYIHLKEIPGNISKLWTGIKREKDSFTLDVTLFSDSTVINHHEIWIEKGDPTYVSQYVKGVSIPLQLNEKKATAVTIVPRGIYSFACLGPILEFIYE